MISSYPSALDENSGNSRMIYVDMICKNLYIKITYGILEYLVQLTEFPFNEVINEST